MKVAYYKNKNNTVNRDIYIVIESGNIFSSEPWNGLKHENIANLLKVAFNNNYLDRLHFEDRET